MAIDLAIAIWRINPLAEYRLTDDKGAILEWRGPGVQPEPPELQAAYDAWRNGQQAEQAQAAFLSSQTDDVAVRWLAHSLNGLTPAEIYQKMQGAIDGWTSLAQAKTALREWLPLLAAIVAWRVMQNKRTG